jgi:hypothetical protein
MLMIYILHVFYRKFIERRLWSQVMNLIASHINFQLPESENYYYGICVLEVGCKACAVARTSWSLTFIMQNKTNNLA